MKYPLMLCALLSAPLQASESGFSYDFVEIGVTGVYSDKQGDRLEFLGPGAFSQTPFSFHSHHEGSRQRFSVGLGESYFFKAQSETHDSYFSADASHMTINDLRLGIRHAASANANIFGALGWSERPLKSNLSARGPVFETGLRYMMNANWELGIRAEFASRDVSGYSGFSEIERSLVLAGSYLLDDHWSIRAEYERVNYDIEASDAKIQRLNAGLRYSF